NDRLTHRVFEIAVNLLAVTLHHQDHDDLLARIDLENCAERTVPSVTAAGALPPGLDWVQHHFHAEAQTLARPTQLPAEQRADVVGSEQLDRARAEQTLAIELASVDEHLGEAREILRPGRESSGPGEVRRAGNESRRRQLLQALCRTAINRRQTRLAIVRHHEKSVFHSYRLQHPLLNNPIQQLPPAAPPTPPP